MSLTNIILTEKFHNIRLKLNGDIVFETLVICLFALFEK